MTNKSALLELADGFSKIPKADRGLRYSSGHGGKQKYDEDTGMPYWTPSRPAELTVYGEMATLFMKAIESAPDIAAALRALEEKGE